MLRAGTLKGKEDAKPATFLNGVILLLLNPKAYVIIALMFTQFLELSNANMVASVLLISTVFTLNNLLAFSIWTLIGDSIAGTFKTPDRAQKLNLIFGTILAAVAIWMLLS